MNSLVIDLNADLAEGTGWDGPLLQVVTSVNLCCGVHAGSVAETDRVLRLAVVEKQVRPLGIGAHPGLPDRQGMGRSMLEYSLENLADWMIYQVEVLVELAEKAGTRLTHLKPHGALYHMAGSTGEVATAVVAVAQRFDLAVLGLPASALHMACQGRVPFWAEGFAERGYTPEGGLIPRGQPGDLLTDPDAVSAQVGRLASDGVATICVHGDSPGALALAIAARRSLALAGYRLQPVSA